MAAVFQHKRSSGFRRRKFVRPRRRRGAILAFLRAVGLALLLVAAPVATAFWFCYSDEFVLREVVAHGTDRVSAGWIEGVVQEFAGTHLLWLSLPEVEARLRRHEWVAAVEVRKELPSTLIVRVEDRQPVALLRRGEDLFYVDSTGRAFAAFVPGEGPADLTLLSSPVDDPATLSYAIELMDRLRAVAPSWSAGLSELELLNRGDVRLYTEVLPFPVLLSDVGFETGVSNLRRYLPEVVREFPSVDSVDLRFAKQMVIRPAALPRSQKG